MFCPQCSQQQSSNEVRFCSRCGLPLSGVSLLLSNGGNLPGVSEGPGKPELSPRKKGYRQAFILIMLCFVLAPLAGAFRLFEPMPGVFFLAGLARLIYARYFEEAESNPKPAQPLSGQINPGFQSTYLPPQSVPVNNFPPKRIDTAEIVERPSVTEHTTKLLEQEPQS